MKLQQRNYQTQPTTFAFRVIHPEVDEADDWQPVEGGSSLSPLMTLPEFFEAWYLPVVLIGQNDDSESTIKLHRDALRYWAELTQPKNPPLRAITDEVISAFTPALRNATWKRGIVGKERPLAKHTVAKHLKNIRAVLSRVGPTLHPKRPGKALVSEVPYIAVSVPKAKPKPCFSLEVARKIVAASREVETPEIPGIPSWRWWQAVLCGFFYSGTRAGTIFSLEWDWLQEREDGYWFDIPAGAVKKTHKAIEVPVHPAWLKAILGIRTSDPKVYPRPFCYEHFSVLHDRAQTLAGIPADKQLSPQAWRRTHGQEMLKLGARFGIKAAQLALDHADSSTTLGNYVTLATIMRQLPLIAEEDDPRQAKLF